MQKSLIILAALLLSGCSTTAWHEGMCEESSLELIEKKRMACMAEWREFDHNTSFSYTMHPEVTVEHMELTRFHCEAKSKYKQCD